MNYTVCMHAFGVLMCLASILQAGAAEDSASRISGDREAYRLVANSQRSAWAQNAGGHARVKVKSKISAETIATYDVWWRNHNAVRWEGSVTRDGRTRPVLLILAKDELIDATLDDKGSVTRVERRSPSVVEVDSWLLVTPHSLWHTTRPGGPSLASAIDGIAVEPGLPVEVERQDSRISFKYFDADGELGITTEFDQRYGCNLIKRTYPGGVNFQADWTEDGRGRHTPKTISWSPRRDVLTGGRPCEIEFLSVDLDDIRPDQDFTLQSLRLSVGTIIWDMRSDIPTFVRFGKEAEPKAADIVDAAAKALRGQGFGADK